MDRIGVIELSGDVNVLDMPAHAVVLYGVQDGNVIKIFAQGKGEELIVERRLNFLRVKDDVPPNWEFIMAIPYMTEVHSKRKLEVLFLYEDTTGQDHLKVIPLSLSQETDDDRNNETQEGTVGETQEADEGKSEDKAKDKAPES